MYFRGKTPTDFGVDVYRKSTAVPALSKSEAKGNVDRPICAACSPRAALERSN